MHCRDIEDVASRKKLRLEATGTDGEVLFAAKFCVKPETA